MFGLSSQQIYVVGENGTILSASNDGSHFSTEDSGSMLPLYGIWGSGPADFYAVGQNGTILHRIGPVTGGSGGIDPPPDLGTSGTGAADLGGTDLAARPMSMPDDLPTTCEPSHLRRCADGRLPVQQRLSGRHPRRQLHRGVLHLHPQRRASRFVHQRRLCTPDGMSAYDNCFPPA